MATLNETTCAVAAACRLAVAIAAIAAIVALGVAPAAEADPCAGMFTATSGECKVVYTGAPVQVAIPGGVKLEVIAAGASGGEDAGQLVSCGDGLGGGDGGDLDIDSPETLTIEVGGLGGTPDTGVTGGAGGYGGGGNGGNGDLSNSISGGGGGGGATWVFDQSHLLVVAGGGGGGSSGGGDQGGRGGGAPVFDDPRGGCGVTGGPQPLFGGPGTASAGGAAGDGGASAGTGPGTNAVGSFGNGGNGADGPAAGAGGGGGGGLFGGGGGGAGVSGGNPIGDGGGGGGSGYLSPLFTGNPISNPQEAIDDGFVTLQISPLCAAATPASDLRWNGLSPLRNAAATSPCKLNVAVAAATRFHAGLSRTGGDEPAFIDTSNEQCVSGCTSVTATVTDSNGNAVAGATVNASVTGITDSVPDYPLGAPSPGFVCNAAAPTQCGSGGEVTGLTTNSKGQVSLLYWAPGVTKAEQATITVTASKCSTQCTAGSETGTGNAALTVAPNVIYTAHMQLSKQTAKALAEWSQSKTLAEVLKDKAIELLIGAAIGKAAEFMVESEEAAHAIDEIGEYALDNISYFKHLNLEGQFMELFLAGFKLRPTGLGHAPDEHRVSAFPGKAFEKAFVGAGNLIQLGHGLLWRLAIAEHTAEEEDRLAQQVVHLTVFEVSYCAQARPCGPGYHDQAGIRPYLDLEMTSSSREHVIFPYSQAVTPYNANAWMLAQFLK